MSDAVNQLCVSNLLQNMQRRCPSALQSSNAFRTRFCYIEATSVVLEQNIASLRALYESYAEVSRGAPLSPKERHPHTHTAGPSKHLTPFGTWARHR